MKRVLFYNIHGQILSEVDTCDYSNIIKGTKNYLHVCFNFDSTWDGTNKVIEVSNEHDFSNSHAVAIKNDCAMIPNDMTDGKEIYFRVFGRKGSGCINTNKLVIKQT